MMVVDEKEAPAHVRSNRWSVRKLLYIDTSVGSDESAYGSLDYTYSKLPF